jgi:hypothetical protein
MKPLEQRVSTLEAAEGYRGTTGRLVLLAPHGELTAEQRTQAAGARAAGRDVYIIELRGLVRDGNA